ncbi:hypothetical protein F4781DRAFT_431439 [Annulohypoxylon bovei var. microspora]|nr:hypothetical protein F4781DRAFT_431439 [Annulohypoxylon bovei var. microspora]
MRAAKTCGRKVGNALLLFILLSNENDDRTNSNGRRFIFTHRNATPRSSPVLELDRHQPREVIDVTEDSDENDEVNSSPRPRTDHRFYGTLNQGSIPRPFSPIMGMPSNSPRPRQRAMFFSDEEELELPQSATGSRKRFELGTGVGNLRADEMFKYGEFIESDPIDIDEDNGYPGEYTTTQSNRYTDKGKGKEVVRATETGTVKRVPNIVITQV